MVKDSTSKAQSQERERFFTVPAAMLEDVWSGRLQCVDLAVFLQMRFYVSYGRDAVDRGVCFPSAETLKNGSTSGRIGGLGMGVRQIKEARRRLVEAGYLIQFREGRKTKYGFLDDEYCDSVAGYLRSAQVTDYYAGGRSLKRKKRVRQEKQPEGERYDTVEGFESAIRAFAD